jgi:Flp pilus assembly pilin Flp
MGMMLKGFLKKEDGLGTVEIVIIIAVLVAVALIFRNAIIGFVKDILDSIFGDSVKDTITNVVPSGK